MLVIPDETLREAGLDERKALVEFACRLFDAGILTLWSAAKLAGMNLVEFEQELLSRKIPLVLTRPERSGRGSRVNGSTGSLIVAITSADTRSPAARPAARGRPCP